MESDPAKSREHYIEGMSYAASTVSVITTDGEAGRGGLTVSAMSSVSADPPTLLICVHQDASAADALIGNKAFCVNVLRDDQSRIADTFAGRIEPPDGDRFSCASWRIGPVGAPALEDTLVVFHCRLERHLQSGSHYVLIAGIEQIDLAESGSPLIYANRAYGIPVSLEGVIGGGRAWPGMDTGEQINVGCFVTVGPFFMPQLLAGFNKSHPDIQLVCMKAVKTS